MPVSAPVDPASALATSGSELKDFVALAPRPVKAWPNWSNTTSAPPSRSMVPPIKDARLEPGRDAASMPTIRPEESRTGAARRVTSSLGAEFCCTAWEMYAFPLCITFAKNSCDETSLPTTPGSAGHLAPRRPSASMMSKLANPG